MACTGPAPLVANFTAAPGGGRPPYTYAWSFGVAGGTSAEQNPSYEYNEPGEYTAVCTITDLCGNTKTQTVPVTVTEPDPPYECDGCSVDSGSFNMTFSGCTGRYVPLNGTTITFAYDPAASLATGLPIWSASVVAVDGTHKIALNCVPPSGNFSVYSVNYDGGPDNWDNGTGTCTPFCYRIVGIYWYSGGPTDGMAYVYTTPEDDCTP